MDKATSPVRCRLPQPAMAVKLQEYPGSSLKSPTDTLVEIPANAMVELQGAVAPSGLVNVVWDGQTFSILYEDLKDNGQS